MAHMMIRHKVKDFNSWKSAFDAHRPARQAAGLRDLYLWNNVDDPSEVLILFDAADPSRARTFAKSEDLKSAMERAGVLGRPEITLLRD